MPPQIFLAPCSKQQGDSRAYRHLLDTIVGGVDLDKCTAATKRSGEMAVWGLTDGNRNRWEAINQGDYFLFYTGDEKYEYAARVIDKEANLELALELWPDYGTATTGGDDPGDPWEYIVYLEFPTRINLDSREVHNPAGHKRNFTQRFMRLNEQGLNHILSRFGSVEEFIDDVAISSFESERPNQNTDDLGTSSSRGSIDPDEQSVDVEPPEKTEVQVSRVIRNTALSKEIKELYNHRCQVCGTQRMRGPGEPYAEAHHVRPLGATPPGPDVEENIIVLCPDHHADFDYGMIEVDSETFVISHAYEGSLNGKRLNVEAGHNLSTNFFQYHNENVSIM